MSVVAQAGVCKVWGAVQDLSQTAASVTLSATGAGVWAPVDNEEGIRAGDFSFPDDAAHSFWVGLYITAFAGHIPSLRIRDATSGLTLATAQCYLHVYFHSSEAFSNQPTENSRLHFEYTLTDGEVEWYLAAWEWARL